MKIGHGPTNSDDWIRPTPAPTPTIKRLKEELTGRNQDYGIVAELVDTLERELAAKDRELADLKWVVEGHRPFNDWAQEYLDAGRWAGYRYCDAIMQELKERDAERDQLRTEHQKVVAPIQSYLDEIRGVREQNDQLRAEVERLRKESDVHVKIINDADRELEQAGIETENIIRQVPPAEGIRQLRAALAAAQATLDWAETLLCNAKPLSHCTQDEWDELVHKWRDQKHRDAIDHARKAQP